MRLIAYFVVIATSLAVRVDLSTVSAAEEATASTPEQRSVPDTLPGRAYPLKWVASNSLRSMIEPLLSKQGKINVLEADHDIVVVQDNEEVLKILDRIVAEVDVQPKQVLIEAVIVRVDSAKGPNTEAGSSILERFDVHTQVVGNGIPASIENAASAASSDKPVDADITGVGEQAKAINFGSSGDTTKILHALQGLGEIKVLACPRLLVLNKHRAEIHFGGYNVAQTTNQGRAESSSTAKSFDGKTCVRLQPFVASNGMIRLEIHIHDHQESADLTGVPATDATELTTNIMMSDGATVMVGGLTDTVDAPSDKEAAADSATKNKLLVIVTLRLWKPEASAKVSQLGNLAFEDQPTGTSPRLYEDKP